MDGDDWFTLAELTERLGGLVWVEEQLAELLANWASTEEVASAAVFFATTSRHHQWHAQVVRDCLPTSPRLLISQVVRAPTVGWERAIVSLGELSRGNGTVPRLKALAKVIDPWLDREIGALGDVARPVSDAAMMRWLRFVSLDHHDDAAAAGLLSSSHASSSAASVEDHRLISSLDLAAN